MVDDTLFATQRIHHQFPNVCDPLNDAGPSELAVEEKYENPEARHASPNRTVVLFDHPKEPGFRELIAKELAIALVLAGA